jgi:hypothetical protein
MITKVTIYGERCSGTNYLEELIKLNFNITITWEYGWKHFFGFNDLKNSDETLFIGIVRNPYDWLNSFYREQHHLPSSFKNIDTFLNGEFYSINNDKSEIMVDRNMYTKQRYKNIFDMRYSKIKFLKDKMPLLVKNYIFISYESLLTEFNSTMNKIKNKGLIIKNINFPLNVDYYRKDKKHKFLQKSKINHISKEKIINKLDMFYETDILKYKI